MKKNTLILLLGLFITLFIIDGKHVFAEVFQNKGGIVSNPVYDSDVDQYNAKYDRFKVKKIIHRTYSDSTYSTVGYDGVINIDSPYDVTGSQFWTCQSYFEDIYYDANGNELGSLRFFASDIKNKKCNSNIADNADEPDSPEACVNAICKCIQELNETAKEINGSVNSTGGKITDAVNANGEKINDTLKNINVDTSGILDELTTSDDIMDSPDITEPEIPKVPGVNLGADPEVFHDDKVYFEDPGDAKTPGKMPDTPDIAECWDKTDDKVCKGSENKAEEKLEKDDSLKKEDENKKDDSLKKDKQMEKDTMKKDEQMNKETFKKDEQMNKDTMKKDEQMNKETFKKDEQMNKDTMKKDEQMEKDIFDSENKYNKTPELDRESFYSKTSN